MSDLANDPLLVLLTQCVWKSCVRKGFIFLPFRYRIHEDAVNLDGYDVYFVVA